MDKLIRKKIGSWFLAKKPQRNGFFGVFNHYCTKTLRNFLCCSDDAQTYRIVAYLNFESGKTKVKPQNSSQFLSTTSETPRVSRSSFSLREILARFSF